MQGDLKTDIADHGGVFSSKVTDECTHLVANQKQYEAKGAKGEQLNLMSFSRLLLFCYRFGGPPIVIGSLRISLSL